MNARAQRTLSLLVLLALVAAVVASEIYDATPAAATGVSSWAPQNSGTTNTLVAASCPSITTCYAVGYGGTIINTIDGGSTWASQTPVGLFLSAFNGIDCGSTTTCVAVGFFGLI